MIVDTHVHVFTDDRKKYPQIRDTRARRLHPDDHRDRPDRMAAHDASRICIAQMDEAGVDKATLVQAYFVYEYDNRYTIDAALAHPDRFTARRRARSAWTRSRRTSCPAWSRSRSVTGIRFMRGRLPESSLGEPATFPLWERMQSLEDPVAVGDRIGGHLEDPQRRWSATPT